MTTFKPASIIIDHFLEQLDQTYLRIYGGLRPEYPDIMRSTGLMAMEIIANSSAFYHDIEHSMMVTLVGQEILRGKYLREGDIKPKQWLHYTVSLLCHDIGYVPGICPGDSSTEAVMDADGNTISVPPGATNAFLTPYHVERGKLFVRWRFKDHPIIDPEIIVANIEHTRFPVPTEVDIREDKNFPGLVQAADLIGQLADPDYLRKIPALFAEFVETGANKQMGYTCAEDVREKYPDFYWTMVSQHIGPALEYLHVTSEGRQWEHSLYSHIFSQKHRARL